MHGLRAVCIASTTYCFTALPRSTNRGKLPSTVRFKTTRGKTASMGLGHLSLHEKQCMPALANAIARSEGNWQASLANQRNRPISSDVSGRARRRPE
ncbi:hypothetical protein Bxe_B0227 [Paraburkholderia xenovorans LB400]|uniref:Uncharacterized protein n=1 Tax=Paraburkholderia xenovorans (strain LB400) TaxID=266265 RepID=Q13JM3_PARXL|nr:hypothetical protein Bxe_B0227 [Paraburkholderia xenovorans LB400]